MKTASKVSIIVPVYNTERYLKECIDSLLNQTYENIEIILIDDGSTDKSGSICDDYAERYDRVKTIHQENQGLVSTWIRGTTECRGDYLCYVDSDDWIEPDMIMDLLAETTNHPREMICSNFSCDFPSKSVEEKNKLAQGVYEGDTLKQIQQQRLLGNDERTILFSRSTKLIARRLVEDNIHFSDPALKMGEDLNIMLPAMLDCERIVVVDKAYYHYRQYGSSMVHAYNANLYPEIRHLIQIVRHILLEKKVPEADVMAAKEYIILLLLVVKNEIRGNTEYIRSLQSIFTDKETRQLIQEVEVQVKEKAKRLIYFGMKHPSRMYWVGLKILMQLKGTF